MSMDYVSPDFKSAGSASPTYISDPAGGSFPSAAGVGAWSSASSFFDFDDLGDAEGSPISSPDEVTREEPLVFGDKNWRPRGSCQVCCHCELWDRGPLTSTLDHWRYTNCHRCWCPTDKHEDLGSWLGYTLQRSKGASHRVRTRMLERGIPLAAFRCWSPDDVRLFIETSGAFHPGRHGRRSSERPRASGVQEPGDIRYGGGASGSVVCSVICPTTTNRQPFHGVLYASYLAQTYEPRELIVLDTGSYPSKFLMDCAREDSSLVYRWIENGSAISVGMKRNIACSLCCGDIVAHFDDDDLYAVDYLEEMVARVLSAAGDAPEPPPGPKPRQPPLALRQKPDVHVEIGAVSELACAAEQAEITIEERGSLAESPNGSNNNSCPGGAAKRVPIASRMAAVTLGAWHVYDAARGTFSYLVANDAVSIYGWGFSFAYTKAAWTHNPFPDVTLSEDYSFMAGLRAHDSAIVRAVTFDHAKCVCAHTLHPGVSVSGGERQSEKHFGWRTAATPHSLHHLLQYMPQNDGVH